MGTSTDAVLIFGYDLKSPDDWYDDEHPLNWSTSDDGMGDEERIEDRLLEKLVDFTEEWTEGSVDYYKRRRDAIESMGVELDSYCSAEYPMYFLAARGSETRASRGDAVVIDSLYVAPHWVAKLTHAAEALGLSTDEPPKWHLYSMWS